MTSPLSTQEREQSGNRAAGWLSLALVVLAVGIATTSVLGPVGLGLMRYRTSPTTLNQLLGSDAASLFVVAPLTLVAAVLTARRHPVGPLLALGVGVYALYTTRRSSSGRSTYACLATWSGSSRFSLLSFLSQRPSSSWPGGWLLRRPGQPQDSSEPPR